MRDLGTHRLSSGGCYATSDPSIEPGDYETDAFGDSPVVGGETNGLPAAVCLPVVSQKEDSVSLSFEAEDWPRDAHPSLAHLTGCSPTNWESFLLRGWRGVSEAKKASVSLRNHLIRGADRLGHKPDGTSTQSCVSRSGPPCLRLMRVEAFENQLLA
ncbi:hypothetical protein MYCTH_2308935 [Thermothelomyces thermophilus ATCC 42464]|uniref:Uncharacterized protein n=1 Tax=Thermothelomyces thermophilus (strain ATCC 42464 / BCRC 31852 / DSM 1799) TaxID=573729 RepID=G2QKI2_THET4|nr:uncharacterized protein MYCTH_2308935 [Thermothelomyces thermophilus ATCC 42464]AEO60088.1 hypothetical protein MYCTH_2308935 [Thermothelomyces thermophilus ATCC 42464]